MPAPVDIDRLQAFCDGSAEGLRTVVDIFLTDTLETLDELAAAVERSDAEAIRLLAHRAGGSSAACGASPLAALLFQLETPPSARTAGNDAEVFRGVTAEFDAVKRFLEACLEGLRT